MPRYILIDNASGYIWADTEDARPAISGTPLEVAREVDEQMQEFGRTYEEVAWRALAMNETGYHVYAAPADFPRIENGQDQDEIEAVERDCRYVVTIKTDDREGPADSMLPYDVED